MAYESVIALGLFAGIVVVLASFVLSVMRTLSLRKIARLMNVKPIRSLEETIGQVPQVEQQPIEIKIPTLKKMKESRAEKKAKEEQQKKETKKKMLMEQLAALEDGSE